MEKLTITGNMKECVDLIKRNNNEVIIIEGARGIGKSTFCKYLSDLFDIPVVTAWQNRKDLGVNYLQAQLDISQTGFGFLDMYLQIRNHLPPISGKPKLIIDRGYLTAAIFQNAYSVGKMRLYKELLKKARGIILYIRNKKLEVVDREEPDVDYDYKDIDLQEEDNLFWHYLNRYFSDMYHVLELDTPSSSGIMYFM